MMPASLSPTPAAQLPASTVNIPSLNRKIAVAAAIAIEAPEKMDLATDEEAKKILFGQR